MIDNQQQRKPVTKEEIVKLRMLWIVLQCLTATDNNPYSFLLKERECFEGQAFYFM
jgi:hypothetical protein